MDMIEQLGEMALASRLRRLADRLLQDVAEIYKAHELAFEPRWFPLFSLLKQVEAPITIGDSARALGVTHSSVNQLAAEMIQAGIVTAVKDSQDKRKRLLLLTDEGYQLLDKLKPVWQTLSTLLRNYTQSTQYDILDVLEKMEMPLHHNSLLQGFQTQQKQQQAAQVKIIEYQPTLKAYFKSLNEAWITHYFAMEPDDYRVLENPEDVILNPGGHIFFAKLDEAIVGTCALIRFNEGYELARMGVTASARGKQVGKCLLEASIQKAKDTQAQFIVLETSSKLVAAIQLYRSLGFKRIARDTRLPSKVERADIWMRLDFPNPGLS